MARTELEPHTAATEPTAVTSRRWVWITAAVLAVPLLAAAWWLVRPALVDDRVDTAFPVTIQDAQDPAADGAGDEPGDAPMAEPDDGVVGDPMDGGVVVPDPPGASGEAADEGATEDTQAEQAGSAEQSTEEPAEVAGPELVARGSFIGLDDHDASGDAALFRQPDGTYVVRLEEIDVDNGPGLQLHLVPGRDRTRPADGSFVAPLQGNQGNQTYELPADWTPSDELTVLIWCEPFSVAVGGATLDR